jgi:hypothetical protein
MATCVNLFQAAFKLIYVLTVLLPVRSSICATLMETCRLKANFCVTARHLMLHVTHVQGTKKVRRDWAKIKNEKSKIKNLVSMCKSRPDGYVDKMME